MLCRALYLIFIDISLSQVTLPEHTPPGSTVVTVTATDRDSGENGKITYSVMSSTQDGFYIDPNNGSLHSFIHCLARVLKEDDRSFITFGNHHCLIFFFFAVIIQEPCSSITELSLTLNVHRLLLSLKLAMAAPLYSPPSPLSRSKSLTSMIMPLCSTSPSTGQPAALAAYVCQPQRW